MRRKNPKRIPYYNIIDYQGNIVIEKFSQSRLLPVWTGTNYYFTFENGAGKYGLYDRELKEVMAPFSTATPRLSEDEKTVIFYKGEYQGLMDLKGNVLIEPNFTSLSPANLEGTLLATNYSNEEYLLFNTEGQFLYESPKKLTALNATNLFFEFSEADQLVIEGSVLNSKGGEMTEDYLLLFQYGNMEVLNDMVVVLEKSYSEQFGMDKHSKYALLNREGQIIGENLISYHDLDKYVFTQDDADMVRIVEKKSGKIVREKEIETEEMTDSSDVF